MDVGGAPIAADEELDPHTETPADTNTDANDAAVSELDPIPETTGNPNIDTNEVAADTVADESSDSASADTETSLVLRSSSTDVIEENISEQIDKDSPLTDPKTWRNIIDTCFRNNQCLTHLWKNEVVPRIGITCPYDDTVEKPENMVGIAACLKAFGLALKPYYTKKITIK